MAVKQKVVEGLSPSSAEARLQIILRVLKDITAQGLPEKMCAQVVMGLGTIHVPTDPKSYMQFMVDIKSVQEILAKECSKHNLMYMMLNTLYSEISNGERQPSPAMSIVLQLVPAEYVPKAVDLILQSSNQSGYSATQGLKNALRTLCIWLTKWTATENLGPLVLAFMQGLEAQQQYDILLDVTLLTLEPLFKMLILPESRKSVGPIVLHMLTQSQHCPEVFHKVLPYVGRVVKYLDKEKTESSLSYLQDIVNICVALMEHFPQYKHLYGRLKDELELYLPTKNYKQSLSCKPWMDGMSLVTSIQESIGKVGLNNLGNTCYMNSVLQALFMTKTFRNQVLLQDGDVCLDLFTKLQVFFALLQHSKRPSLSPIDILNLARPPGFTAGQQHDSSEFLGYLLDSLHEQEKSKLGQDDEAASPSSTTLVQSVFGGRTVSASRCDQCGTKSERVDNFRELQLSFPSNSDNQSVQALLEYYLQPEKLSGDNQYQCDVCQSLTDGERITCIDQGPPRLILTLKHFRYDSASHQRTKLLQSVKLDNQVHLDCGNYELYAAVVHSGDSLDSGHYYTFAKEGEDWFKFNDCIVTKSVSDELYGLQPSDTPYILFYSRQDCSEPDNLQRALLSQNLQVAINDDNFEFESEKRKRPVMIYNVRRNYNDEPPPPGCGGSPFSNNSSNMFVC